MKIAVIGAGWYGCHLSVLLRRIEIDVTVFERNSTIFSGASGKNQNRLHLGFHYARDYKTRMQSREGFSRFLERYPHLSAPVSKNIYAVPEQDSVLDFLTYKTIMASSGIEFRELDVELAESYGLARVSGLLNTNEQVVATNRAEQHFSRRLSDILRLNTPVTLDDIVEHENHVEVFGERYDFVIDATWGKLTKTNIKTFLEPTLLLYYETQDDDFALTMVDGQLCSIYPTDQEGIVTLSSVPHTPLGTFDNPAKAEAFLDGLNDSDVQAKRLEFEEQIRTYFPNFDDIYRYIGPQFSMKTKPFGAQDNRACYVFRNGRIFQVMSGKIDTIFVAAELILSQIANAG